MQSLRNFTLDRCGSMTLGMGLTFAMVLGAASAGIDVSRAINERNSAQRALDSAVLAAATAEVDTEAQRSAIASQLFRENAPASCNSNIDPADVTVHNKPTAVDYKLTSRVISEVVTTKVAGKASCKTNAAILQIAGFRTLETNVEAVASDTVVTTPGDPTGACLILVLSEDESEALRVNSSSTINAQNCLIQVNSSAQNALLGNSGGNIIADQICVNGGIANNGSNFSPLPEKCDPVPDPFVSLQAPEGADRSCDYRDVSIDGRATLSPGVYCGRLEVNDSGDAFFEPGIYVLRDAEFIVNANSKITAHDVTFYMTGKDGNPRFNFNSGSTVDIKATKSGEYAGLAFYQDPNTSADDSIINSGSKIDIEGVIYLPKSGLVMNSNGRYLERSKWSAIIVDTMTLNSDSVLTIGNKYKRNNVGLPEFLVPDNVNQRTAVSL